MADFTERDTERGFQRVDFRDRIGTACSLQQSSAAINDEPGTGAIWLGCGGDRMHLDRERLKPLLEYLRRWSETGHLYAAGRDL